MNGRENVSHGIRKFSRTQTAQDLAARVWILDFVEVEGAIGDYQQENDTFRFTSLKDHSRWCVLWGSRDTVEALNASSMWEMMVAVTMEEGRREGEIRDSYLLFGRERKPLIGNR